MSDLINITGQRFNKWTVLRRDSNSKGRHARWLCRCDCGRVKIINGKDLRYGKSRQCNHCKSKIHGFSGTRLYQVWIDMIHRCENSNHKYYKYYGGRGISICLEWHDFMAFRKWALANGYKYYLTIDRIKNDGDYKPENCQFLTNNENVWKAWHIDGSFGEKYLIAS